MTAREQERPARSAADGSPLHVMLTDAAVEPVRRLLPGRARRGSSAGGDLAVTRGRGRAAYACGRERSGECRAAPTTLGSAMYQVIVEARGADVMEP